MLARVAVEKSARLTQLRRDDEELLRQALAVTAETEAQLQCEADAIFQL
jgi:hypothetical protein